MPKQGHSRSVVIDGLIAPTKIRKRGCSSSSSSSSRIHHYRLNKKAVVLSSKNRSSTIRSSSCTPVPKWRTTPLRSAVDSPKQSQGGKSTRPVSARRLAATLWEMNEMPSPNIMSESSLVSMTKKANKSDAKAAVKMEKVRAKWGINGRVALPPHLSDPSHSPSASEKMDRSGTGRNSRKAPSISQKLRTARVNVAGDSVSNASFMEIETRSRYSHISSSSAIGNKNRLKDISNALITSKELLKIINRIWAPVDQPSSSMSLVLALHAELERARLQTNKLIQEQTSDNTNEVGYLMKLFAEEKASWKDKEQRAIENAITSAVNELEVERKLRRRLESLNKKLGKELAETKSAFVKVVKDLESEKRAREVAEQMCNEFGRNGDGDGAEEVEKLKRDERETLEIGDKLQKISEGKNHQYEEKNSAIRKLRKQLEVFLGAKKEKNQERASTVNSRHQEIEDNASESSDLHSIVLSRNSVPRKGNLLPLQRSVSEGFEDLNNQREKVNKDAPRRSYNEERQMYYRKKDHNNLSGTRMSLTREYLCPTPPREQVWPSRDPLGTIEESPSLVQASGFKPRESTSRKSKW